MGFSICVAIGNIGNEDIGQSTVFSCIVSGQEIIPFGFKPSAGAENFLMKQKDESFHTKVELALYLVENGVIFEGIVGIKTRYVVADEEML
jgi:hypothetical protein